MNLIEPQRGQDILLYLNTAVFDSPLLTQIIPVLADVFVFAYPLILVIWYITGIVKQNTQIKSDALTIFSGAAYVVIINMILQSFLLKDRPIFSGDGAIHLILNELPSAAFPSDHAAVSMVIAVLIGLIAYKNQNTGLKYVSIILVICSIVMSISRVAVGVHWPTDIIAGWGVAVVVCLLLSVPAIGLFQTRYINSPLIKLQNWIMDITGLTSILPK